MKKTSSSTIGHRIAQSRRLLGVRLGRDVLQSDLAAELGVGAATVSRWEADQAVPRDAVLTRLADYLGVTPEFLRYNIEPTATYGGRVPDAEVEAATARSTAKRAAHHVGGRPPAKRARGS